MKKIFLILFFFSSTQPNSTFKKLCDKIKLHAPHASQLLGIFSLLILQAKNKKTLPFARIFSLFKQLKIEINERNIARIAAKMITLNKDCTLLTCITQNLNTLAPGDNLEAKKETLSQAWIAFVNDSEKLEQRIKNLQIEEKEKKDLFFTENKERIDARYIIEDGPGAPRRNPKMSELLDIGEHTEKISQCVIDDYTEELYKDIIKRESENNFLIKFFCNFSKKLEYGLLFGELQFALYLLFVIYSSATQPD